MGKTYNAKFSSLQLDIFWQVDNLPGRLLQVIFTVQIQKFQGQVLNFCKCHLFSYRKIDTCVFLSVMRMKDNVCAFARCGTGTGDIIRKPQSNKYIIDNLHDLSHGSQQVRTFSLIDRYKFESTYQSFGLEYPKLKS